MMQRSQESELRLIPVVAFIVLVLVGLAVAGCGSKNKSASSTPTKVDGPGVTTPSGLQYWDITVGSGTTADLGDLVKVNYTGWLTTGEKFDSSFDHNEPFAFPLGAGHVIKGWDEGVAGMKIGGKRQLRIPSNLGYGAAGAGGVIPPNATLIFDVELLDVSK